jgi:predicted GIY-YIG superfamily endonuclease
MGGIEYVGSSSNPKHRFYQHTKVKKTSNGCGAFFLRQDLSLHILSEHPTFVEARNKEMELQSMWGFKTENQKSSEERRGEKNGQSKLTENQVKEIKALLKTPITQIAIAEKFGVSRCAIKLIKQNKAWKHVNV